MELQRELQAGYMHLEVINIYMIVDTMGAEELNGAGTESKIRMGSRTEALGEQTAKCGQQRDSPQEHQGVA